jgi:hypothetical protein
LLRVGITRDAYVKLKVSRTSVAYKVMFQTSQGTGQKV